MATSRVLGILRSGRANVPLTERDRLWLARIIGHEEGLRATHPEALALGSVVLRRWAVVTDTRLRAGQTPLWPTVTDLIFDYARWPVSPAEPGRTRAKEIGAMGWEELPEPIRRATDDLLRGRVALTARPAVHWGIPGSSITPEGELPPGTERVPSEAENWLLSTAASRAAREPTVSGTSRALPFLGGLALGLGTMFALARWR